MFCVVNQSVWLRVQGLPVLVLERKKVRENERMKYRKKEMKKGRQEEIKTAKDKNT